MGSARTTELSTSLLYRNSSSCYSLRLVECRGIDGTVHHKFGIIESCYHSKYSRWIPSRKHQPFMPLSVWPKLVACGQLFSNLIEPLGVPVPPTATVQAEELTVDDSVSTAKRSRRPSKRSVLKKTTGARQLGRPRKQLSAAENPLRGRR